MFKYKTSHTYFTIKHEIFMRIVNFFKPSQETIVIIVQF